MLNFVSCQHFQLIFYTLFIFYHNVDGYVSMLSSRQTEALRSSRAGTFIPAQEREQLIKTLLPDEPTTPPAQTAKSKTRRTKSKPIRSTIRHGIHVFLYAAIQFFFGIYLHIRMAARAIKYRIYAIGFYHHRTPELIKQDVKPLGKLPNHLSVMLKVNRDEDKRTNLQRLINEVGEVTAWCISAGIPTLSIYERTGMSYHGLAAID
jgi:dehydrodolichyl diphosphate syntase complex subunit NUS1